MIYLDNSSTTFKKPKKLIKKQINLIKHFSINPSRGAYPLTIKTSLEILETRKIIADYFNAPNIENVIFTSGCTESLNLALMGSKIENGHIITTVAEHNSVLRTLTHLKNTYNISTTFLPINNNNGTIDLNQLKNSLKNNTYMVIINHTSNVTGATQNLYEIGKFCKKNNIIFVVDAAQSAGHEKIDITNQHINYLCIACHKGILGPQGIGVLIHNNTPLQPIKFGGTGTDSLNLTQPTNSPEGFEAGTQNTPGILTLKDCFKYLNKNQDKINIKIKKLSNILIQKLKTINEIVIHNHNPNSGIISIDLKTKSLDQLYQYLNKHNICTRNGLHCAPLIHKYLNTSKSGLIRISIGYGNNLKDIITIVRIIKKFLNKN